MVVAPRRRGPDRELGREGRRNLTRTGNEEDEFARWRTVPFVKFGYWKPLEKEPDSEGRSLEKLLDPVFISV